MLTGDGSQESNKDQCQCPVSSTREDLTFLFAVLALLAGRVLLERLVNVIDNIRSPAAARSARLRNTQLGLTVIK